MDGLERLGLCPGLDPFDFEVHVQGPCLLHLHLLHLCTYSRPAYCMLHLYVLLSIMFLLPFFHLHLLLQSKSTLCVFCSDFNLIHATWLNLSCSFACFYRSVRVPCQSDYAHRDSAASVMFGVSSACFLYGCLLSVVSFLTSYLCVGESFFSVLFLSFICFESEPVYGFVCLL